MNFSVIAGKIHSEEMDLFHKSNGDLLLAFVENCYNIRKERKNRTFYRSCVKSAGPKG